MHPKQLMCFFLITFFHFKWYCRAFSRRLLDIYFFSQGVFFWSRKKHRGILTPFPDVSGGTLEAGRREQETFSLVQPKAQAPDTTPEPLADESPGSMEMEKGAFWSQNENLETRSSGCQVFFSLHIHSNPKILYVNFSYMAEFTLLRHCNLLRRRIGTHYLNDDRHSRHRMKQLIFRWQTYIPIYSFVTDIYMHGHWNLLQKAGLCWRLAVPISKSTKWI